MKILRPITVTDAKLTSSTVAEPSGADPAAWNSGTTYAVGEFCYLASTHRVYRGIQVGNLDQDPLTETGTFWEDYGPTNKWAVFDQTVSTQTTKASPMTYVITPGEVINAVALIDLVGTHAQITMVNGATTVYDQTIVLSTSSITDWYAYYFEPFTQKGTLVVVDLPPYSAAVTTVTITGTTCLCGGIILGTTTDLGGTEYGVTAGIRDYSRKVTDEDTGVVTLEQRKYSKTMRARFVVEAGAVNAVHNILTNLRATPCVWIGDSAGTYEPLIIFGFYKDFQLEVAYPGSSYYSLEVEGMT